MFEMGHTFLELYVAQADADRQRLLLREAELTRLLREGRARPVRRRHAFVRQLVVGVGDRLVAWGARLVARYGWWDSPPAIPCGPELDCVSRTM
jgi:hypothetical protein